MTEKLVLELTDEEIEMLNELKKYALNILFERRQPERACEITNEFVVRAAFSWLYVVVKAHEVKRKYRV